MRRDLAAVHDMLTKARDVVSFGTGHDLRSLEADERTQWAIAFGIVLIGEAANRVSDTFREQHPEVPWANARNMRNVIVHEYDKILLTVLWETVQHSLPALIDQLGAILADEG